MGFLTRLLGLKQNVPTNDSYGAEVNRCMIRHRLKEDEYLLFSIFYYKGSTSYKSFFKNVFGLDNIKKMRIIADAAVKKAKSNCNIDFTFIRFYKNKYEFIDIPFEVFSDKRDMPEAKRNTKLWHRANINRLIVKNPGVRDFDDTGMSKHEVADLNNKVEKWIDKNGKF